jgi:hypothetical protein
MNSTAGNIIHILADLPDFLRSQMLQNRLKEFYGMNDEDKYKTISMVLATIHTISPNKLSVLFGTWLEVLSQFDSEMRMEMFQIYCRQIFANPRLILSLDFKLLTDTFMLLDQKKRERLADSLHEVLLGPPNRNEILKIIPDYSLKAIGIK